FGRWLCPGKGRRLRGTPSLAGIPARDAPVPAQPGSSEGTAGSLTPHGQPWLSLPVLPRSLEEDMEENNQTETWHQSLQVVLDALNQTLQGVVLCPTDRPATTAAAARNASTRAARPLILGYTRSRKVDKRSDPYHVYIKNRVSMI
ncbi:potassium channel, voltage gated subfamily E regulatory beta subunit 3, partial [Columba livia]